jgi:23S rRNA pseudouridine2605 synthase
MHPRHGIEREYKVRVLGEASPEALERLRKGVDLEDGEARFDSVAAEGGKGLNRWYRVVLREGRKREVRRLWEAVGLTVSRLLRVRYGPVRLPRDLQPGEWREIGPGEARALYAAVGLPVPEQLGRPARTRSRRPH